MQTAEIIFSENAQVSSFYTYNRYISIHLGNFVLRLVLNLTEGISLMFTQSRMTKFNGRPGMPCDGKNWMIWIKLKWNIQSRPTSIGTCSWEHKILYWTRQIEPLIYLNSKIMIKKVLLSVSASYCHLHHETKFTVSISSNNLRMAMVKGRVIWTPKHNRSIQLKWKVDTHHISSGFLNWMASLSGIRKERGKEKMKQMFWILEQYTYILWI